MKKYLKNFLLLFIFMSLIGAVDLAPKKYTQYEMKQYLKIHPDVFAGMPLTHGDAFKYLFFGPPEGQAIMKSYMDSYKKIIWASMAAKFILLATFAWIVVRLNRPNSSNSKNGVFGSEDDNHEKVIG